MRTRPGSHIEIGTIDLPRDHFSLLVQFRVKNVGDASGLVSIKLNLIERQLGGDNTWYRFTPLVNDNVAKGPNIITDELYDYTKGRFRGRMILPAPPSYAPFELVPGADVQVSVALTMPGADKDPLIKKFWDKKGAGRDMKVVAELWMVSGANEGLKKLATHTYGKAFSFSSNYVGVSQMQVIGDGALGAASS